MLIGLVTKNGILIVEFANQLRDEGMAVRDAVIEASVAAPAPDPDDRRSRPRSAPCRSRSRTGAGAESRVAIGIVDRRRPVLRRRC